MRRKSHVRFLEERVVARPPSHSAEWRQRRSLTRPVSLASAVEPNCVLSFGNLVKKSSEGRNRPIYPRFEGGYRIWAFFLNRDPGMSQELERSEFMPHLDNSSAVDHRVFDGS